MLPPIFKSRLSKNTEVRQTLSLIQSLVFGLPFIFVLYLQYAGKVDLSGWQVIALAFILMIILVGLVILRQFFERFSAFTDMVQRASEGRVDVITNMRPSPELKEVSGAFGDMLKKMERTNEELSRKVAGLSVMKELLAAVDGCGEMDSILGLLLEKAMIMAGSEIGSIFTIDLENNSLRLVKYQGPGSPPPKNFPMDENSPVVKHVVESKESLLVRNIEQDLRLQLSNDPKYGPPSFISLPVFAGKDFVGVMNLSRKENNKPFDREDERLLSLVVSEMSFALQNAHLQAVCRQHNKEMGKALAKVSEETDSRKKAEAEKTKLTTQMIHAQKMQAIGTLAGGIAHDFNNLLMAIQGNVSLMLLSSNSHDEDFSRLKSIEKQVSSGSKLTGQLLGFARKDRMEWKPIHLNLVVRETSETFGRTRKDIVVGMNIASDLAYVLADRSQIEQIMWNLFINASDAMPNGGSLLLKTKNVSHDEICGLPTPPKVGNYVQLSVRDAGAGIDPAIMDNIFEPFFTTKEIGKGTGLGLASVHGIVKGHGGYVTAMSELGKGSEFSVYLPASVTKPRSTPALANEPVQGSGAILLVDDEQSVLSVGAEMLISLGYKVYSADSGKQAIDIFQKCRREIDVVILDLVMPGLGGAATFEGIMAVDPNAKVLLSSGFDENDESVDLLKRGCFGFMQKPFSINLLSETIHGVITESKT